MKQPADVPVEHLASSIDIPGLPKLHLDQNLEVGFETPEAATEAGTTEHHQVIEVARGALPVDYDLFSVTYPNISYQPDIFQKQSLYYLMKGESIFVTAHTSSGKTLIAEFAIFISSLHNTKVIYTSPIKALSNQKYREFSSKFESVGILTGDAQINSGGRCIVMTTEILRNMLYRTSGILDEVEFIVFDEIHYLGDRERGVVWEEVIILLPRHITLVFLSATSPNAKDMCEWICTTKSKDIYLIGTEKRAVDLEHCLYFRDELTTLCKSGVFSHEEYLKAKKAGAVEVFREKQKVKEFQDREEFLKAPIPNTPKTSSIPKNLNTPKSSSTKPKTKAPYVLDSPYRIAKDLVQRELAPVVFFDFSKSRIEQSFSLCGALDLTTREEKDLVGEFIHDALEKLPAGDRDLPQIAFVTPKLLRGVGMHHSGLLPILKEIVEMLFTTGALRVLFATETLAMGLNMPARTVVLRTLKKYNTETQSYAEINTNEYTQMAGRAGRRGYDLKGTVIIENAGQEILPEDVLIRLQTGKPCKIESKFYITPRMVLKLLRVKGLSVEEMVRLSFGKSKREQEIRKLLQRKKALQNDRAVQAALGDPCPQCAPDLDTYLDVFSAMTSTLTRVYSSLILTESGGSTETRKHALTTPGYTVVLCTGVVAEVLSVTTHPQRQDGTSIRVRHQRRIGLPAPNATANPESLESLENPESLESLEKTPNLKPENLEKPEKKPVPHTLFFDLAQSQAVAPLEEAVGVDGVLMASEDGQTPMVLKPREYTLSKSMADALSMWKTLSSLECVRCPSFAEHYAISHKAFVQQKEIDEIDGTLRASNASSLSVNNYFGYLLFLQKIGYIDASTDLKLKGKTACEFNTIDCVLATEILFSPHVSSITPGHLIIASLSLTFHEKYQLEEDPTNIKHLPRIERVRELKHALNLIDAIVADVSETFKEYSIPYERPNHTVSGEILMWMEGCPLIEIVTASPLSEGVIVKYIKKATEICTEFSVASKILGNTPLAQSIDEVGEKLKRGIVFTPSLYYG
ncbi:antiviral helicase SKI2 [Nematocida displodere]|uniref:Antiviral helicase SKI2 n=1 Tax=Nematocida displodere TaxID=1805483 RepID=A0A177EDG5_9MICR|nr:antiviral helicase SKI2 [Nematocida displodere]